MENAFGSPCRLAVPDTDKHYRFICIDCEDFSVERKITDGAAQVSDRQILPQSGD